MSTVPALSLWEPWAILMALEEKRVETRDRNWNYRGPLAIHATLKWDTTVRTTCQQEPFKAVLAKHDLSGDVLPLGAVLCIVNLIDVVEMKGRDPNQLMLPDEFDQPTWRPPVNIGAHTDLLTKQECAFGNYAPRRYALITEMIERFEKPMPARGQQLWGWPWERP